MLGAFLTALLQLYVGMVPGAFAVATGVAWVASIAMYAYVDEVRRAIEEANRKTLSDESDFYGIE